jgi:hypothetical protein
MRRTTRQVFEDHLRIGTEGSVEEDTQPLTFHANGRSNVGCELFRRQ